MTERRHTPMGNSEQTQETPARPRGWAWAWGAAALGYAAFAVVATFPAVFFAGTYAIGGVRDVWVMIWSNWWFTEALTHYHTSPFFNPLVFYPFGMDMHLLEIRLVPGVLFALFYYIRGQLLAYNLVMLLGIAASGLGMHVLARRITGSHAAAFLSGLCFSTSSYMIGSVASGWVHMAHAEWLPLYVWAVLRMDEKPSAGRGALAGLMLCLAANTSWYYGIYLVIFSLTFAAYKFATRPRDAVRPRFVVAVALLVVVFLAGVLPVAWPTMRKMSGGGIVPKLEIPDVPAALRDYFVPDKEGVARRVEAFAYSCSYIGYATLALAAWGAAAVWRQHAAARVRLGLWLAIAAVSFVLALGPRLHVVNGREATIRGKPVPMPDALVRKVLPFYRFCRNQWRHQCMLVLALSVLVGLGARDLLARPRTRWGRAGVGLLAGGLLIGEASFVSPAPFPTPLLDGSVPQAYQPMLRQSDDYAVVVAPLSYKALYYQTYHRRPLVGYTSRKKVLDPKAMEKTAELFDAADRVLDFRLGGVDRGVTAARELLLRENVGYVIQHVPDGKDFVIRIR